MDTSKEYIKMCEKAEEIQDVLNNNNGYGGEIDKRNNNEPYPTAWIYDKGPRCIECDDILNSKFCPECGSKPQYNVTGYICKGGPSNDDVENSKIVWLPRQDQLQKMVLSTDKTHELNNLSIGFFEFLDIYGTPEDRKYVKNFFSMEQLWLAFVMKEKYQKIWDGKEWLK